MGRKKQGLGYRRAFFLFALHEMQPERTGFYPLSQNVPHYNVRSLSDTEARQCTRTLILNMNYSTNAQNCEGGRYAMKVPK